MRCSVFSGEYQEHCVDLDLTLVMSRTASIGRFVSFWLRADQPEHKDHEPRCLMRTTGPRPLQVSSLHADTLTTGNSPLHLAFKTKLFSARIIALESPDHLGMLSIRLPIKHRTSLDLVAFAHERLSCSRIPGSCRRDGNLCIAFRRTSRAVTNTPAGAGRQIGEDGARKRFVSLAPTGET
jgi:hypothetical protein